MPLAFKLFCSSPFASSSFFSQTESSVAFRASSELSGVVEEDKDDEAGIFGVLLLVKGKGSTNVPPGVVGVGGGGENVEGKENVRGEEQPENDWGEPDVADAAPKNPEFEVALKKREDEPSSFLSPPSLPENPMLLSEEIEDEGWCIEDAALVPCSHPLCRWLCPAPPDDEALELTATTGGSVCVSNTPSKSKTGT